VNSAVIKQQQQREVALDAERRWKAVKAHVAKGDQAKDKAEQHYIAAGQHLAALKAQHDEDGGTWAQWEIKVKEKAGIAKSRASELMQIADGTKTVEQVRTEKAESVRQLRARTSPLRSGENADEPEASAEAMKARFATQDDARVTPEAKDAACAGSDDSQPPPTAVKDDLGQQAAQVVSTSRKAAKEAKEKMRASAEAQEKAAIENIAVLAVKHFPDRSLQSIVESLDILLRIDVANRIRDLRPELFDEDGDAVANHATTQPAARCP
jgi:hypothetical protein